MKTFLMPLPPLYHNSLCHLAGVRMWQPLPGVQLTCSTAYSTSLLGWLMASQTKRVQNQTLSLSSNLATLQSPLLGNGTTFHPGAQPDRGTLDSLFPSASTSHPLEIPIGSTFRIHLWTGHGSPSWLSHHFLVPDWFPCLHSGSTINHSLQSSQRDPPVMQSQKPSLSSKLSIDFPSCLESKSLTPRGFQQGPVRSARPLELDDFPSHPSITGLQHSDVLAIPGTHQM